MSNEQQYALLALPESREKSLLSLILREMGFSIEHCVDPQDAMQKLSEGKTTLAIVDQEQPGFNGIELVRQMRRLRTASHIVLLANDDKSARETGSPFLSGASEVIYRPIEPRRLMSRLEILMKKPLPPQNKQAPSSKNTSSEPEAAKRTPAMPTPPAGKTRPPMVPQKDEGLTRSPFQSVGVDTYYPSFLVAQSHLGRELLHNLWLARGFKHLVTLTGEEGSEFEMVSRELNMLSGCGKRFPLQLHMEDLRDSDFLANLQTRAELRGETGPIVFVDNAGSLEPRQRKVLLEYVEANAKSTKRQLRFVICFVGQEENYDAETWSWVKQVKAYAEANLEIAPLRERRADISAYARKLFYDLTNLHPFLTVRDFEDAALDCLTDYNWKGNFMQLNTVMRSALANCHARSLTLHILQPHMSEGKIAQHLMESVADEKLLYPDFAAVNE